MGLQLPPELIEAMSYLGMTWPEADEDLIRKRGDHWNEFSDQAGNQRGLANEAVETMLATNHSRGLDAFAIYWQRVGGDWGHLNGSVVTAKAFGIAFFACSILVLAMKIAVIVQLIALAIAIVVAIASAFVTVGASIGALAAYAEKVFFAIQRIVDATIQAIRQYGPRLAELVGSLLDVGTTVLDTRPIHNSDDGKHGPDSQEKRQQEQDARDARLDTFERDPDVVSPGQQPTPNQAAKGRREGEIAIGCEEAGAVPGPVTRPTEKEQGDFIDGEGNHWDIKGFRSAQNLPPGAKGAYTDAQAIEIINTQLDEQKRVVIDVSQMSEVDRESLKALIRNHPEWHGKVVIY